jgi:hypothetical protein
MSGCERHGKGDTHLSHSEGKEEAREPAISIREGMEGHDVLEEARRRRHEDLRRNSAPRCGNVVGVEHV